MVEWTQKFGGQANMVESPMEAWEKGMTQAQEMCKQAIAKWTETVTGSTQMMVQSVKSAQPK